MFVIDAELRAWLNIASVCVPVVVEACVCVTVCVCVCVCVRARARASERACIEGVGPAL